MIKRPLDKQFTPAVLEGRKVTTIREKPWPEGKPIMLYNWSGAPYASKQRDVAVVIVESVRKIRITHREDGGMIYAGVPTFEQPVHVTEGFRTRADMDEWFSAVVKRGQTAEKHLMRFRLVEAKQ